MASCLGMVGAGSGAASSDSAEVGFTNTGADAAMETLDSAEGWAPWACDGDGTGGLAITGPVGGLAAIAGAGGGGAMTIRGS